MLNQDLIYTPCNLISPPFEKHQHSSKPPQTARLAAFPVHPPLANNYKPSIGVTLHFIPYVLLSCFLAGVLPHFRLYWSFINQKTRNHIRCDHKTGPPNLPLGGQQWRTETVIQDFVVSTRNIGHDIHSQSSANICSYSCSGYKTCFARQTNQGNMQVLLCILCRVQYNKWVTLVARYLQTKLGGQCGVIIETRLRV